MIYLYENNNTETDVESILKSINISESDDQDTIIEKLESEKRRYQKKLDETEELKKELTKEVGILEKDYDEALSILSKIMNLL